MSKYLMLAEKIKDECWDPDFETFNADLCAQILSDVNMKSDKPIWKIVYSCGTHERIEAYVMESSAEEAMAYVKATRRAYTAIFHYVEELPFKVEIP